MLALQAKPSLPGLADESQIEVLTVPTDATPPAPSSWRASLRNALPNALPWRRWQAQLSDPAAELAQPSAADSQGVNRPLPCNFSYLHPESRHVIGIGCI